MCICALYCLFMTAVLLVFINKFYLLIYTYLYTALTVTSATMRSAKLDFMDNVLLGPPQ